VTVRKVLVLGYGNPGRLDDGLGPAFAEEMARRAIPGVTTDADYQLTVEDAAAVAAHDVVIFADASVNGREPFELSRVAASMELGFSSHSMSPSNVLGMSSELFGAKPSAFALAIRGYEFDHFGERLSPRAAGNLAEAAAFAEELIRTEAFESAAASTKG